MNKKKLITMLSALTLVAVVGIGATLAYFTDSKEIANVVTMGHVEIGLTETEVEYDEETGEYVQKDEKTITEEGLEFDDVIPGQTVPKDPTITVSKSSADCYVRALVTVESTDIAEADMALLEAAIADEITKEGTGWSANEDGYYYYAASLSAEENCTLFETVMIPAEWNNQQADKSFAIKIKAEAVQADYLADDVLLKDAAGNVIGWSLSADQIQEYVAAEKIE